MKMTTLTTQIKNQVQKIVRDQILIHPLTVTKQLTTVVIRVGSKLANREVILRREQPKFRVYQMEAPKLKIHQNR